MHDLKSGSNKQRLIHGQNIEVEVPNHLRQGFPQIHKNSLGKLQKISVDKSRYTLNSTSQNFQQQRNRSWIALIRRRIGTLLWARILLLILFHNRTESTPNNWQITCFFKHNFISSIYSKKSEKCPIYHVCIWTWENTREKCIHQDAWFILKSANPLIE